MKKLYLLAVILTVSAMSFAQQDTLLASLKSDTLAKENAQPQDRVTRLEKEVEALKASHAELQQQLAAIQSRLPVVKKKKLVASRVGSKQGVWVEE